MKNSERTIHRAKQVIDFVELFKILATCHSRYRQSILRSADKKLVHAICTGIYNILIGNIKLDEKETKHLLKYKNILRRLTKKSTFNSKKKILVQHGGLLPQL
jgi:CRISPR/Cas system-associated protein Csx1